MEGNTNKQTKYILLRYDQGDPFLEYYKAFAKKLGMSLSALCKLSLFTYCRPPEAGEKQNEQPPIPQN